MDRTTLKSLSLQAASSMGLEAHVIGWYGPSLLLVYLEGSMGQLLTFRKAVADLVADLTERLPPGSPGGSQ